MTDNAHSDEGEPKQLEDAIGIETEVIGTSEELSDYLSWMIQGGEPMSE